MADAAAASRVRSKRRSHAFGLVMFVCIYLAQSALCGTPLCNLPATPGASFVGSLRGVDPDSSLVTITVGMRNILLMQGQNSLTYLQTSDWQENTFSVSEIGHVSTVTQAVLAPTCPFGVKGNYSYFSNDNCVTITLRTGLDPCTARGASFQALSVTSSAAVPFESYAATCAIVNGDRFRSNNTGVQTSALFTASGGAVLNTTAGDVFALQAEFATDFRTVSLRDVYIPDTNTFAGQCNHSEAGLYDLIWRSDCVGFRLKVKDDVCTRRIIQLDQLALSRNYTAPPYKKPRFNSALASWDGAKIGGVGIILLASLVLSTMCCTCLSMSKISSKKPQKKKKSLVVAEDDDDVEAGNPKPAGASAGAAAAAAGVAGAAPAAGVASAAKPAGAASAAKPAGASA